MGKRIFLALLAGLLVLGVSTAFAEEPQLTDQEILKAWGQAQEEVQQISEATTFRGNQGPQVLTDKDLDKVNAAGILGRYGVAVLTNQYNTFAAVVTTSSCTTLIGVCKMVETNHMSPQ